MSSTNDDSPSSFRPSLVIIIICSAVGGIAAIFLFVRLVICLHRRRVLKPRPLPPARPLTIHGGTYSAHPSQSQLKLNEGYSASMPSMGVYPSTDGLIPQSQSPLGQSTLLRHQSSSTEETPLRQPSPVTPLSADYAEHQLVPPQPSFFVAESATESTNNRSSAQVSLASVTEESDPGSAIYKRPVSLATFPSSAQPPEAITDIRHSIAVPERSPSPNRRPKPRQNRHSLAASMSTMRTAETMRSMRSSRSTSYIRGAPHDPRNRIEIVLPAPLAPQVYPQMTGEGADFTPSADFCDRYAEARSRRISAMSYSDTWLNVGREATSGSTPARPSSSDKSKAKKEGRRASQSRSSRLSLSPSSSHASPSPSTMNTSPYPPSSVSSQSNLTPRELPLDSSALPPVPRVPSMYITSTDSPSSLPLSISQAASRENLSSESPDDTSSSASRSFQDVPNTYASTSSFHDAVEEADSRPFGGR